MAKKNAQSKSAKVKIPGADNPMFIACAFQAQRGNPEGYLRMLELARGGNVAARREFVGAVMTGRVKWTDWAELELWGLEMLEVIPGDAHYMLGCLYYPGMPGFSNLMKSEEYFKQGAAQGSVECRVQLGLLYWQHQREQHSLEEIRRLLECGLHGIEDPILFIDLADICVAQGDAEGELKYLRKWMQLEPNDPEVCCRVAYCYAVGSGCRRNDELALKYYQQAARSGDASALFHVGMFYLDGRGTRKNARRGVEFLRRAVEAGYGSACHVLAGCYMIGNGVEQDDDEATRLLEKGVELKDVECCLEVAMGCIEGEFQPRDLDRAEELLKLAVSYVPEDVQDEMQAQIDEVQRALEEARRETLPTAACVDYRAFVDALQAGDARTMGKLATCFLRENPSDKRSWFCAKVALEYSSAMSPDKAKEIRLMLRTLGELDGDIAVYVGDMYYHGHGMIRNARSAQNFYKRAWWCAKSVDAALRMFLGCHEGVFRNSRLGPEDWLATLVHDANHDARVPYLCGLLHSVGLYLPEDKMQAAACFAAAEKMGHQGRYLEDLAAWLAGMPLRACVLGADAASGRDSIDIC